ncbi:MAG: hypothetical protein Q8N51_00725 [Gammaproteobacteria bacterium]|nr:hypothetical protein [Gammaproteobacteria bacterium]
MTGLFDDTLLSLPCPNCGHETPKTIGWLKTHDEYTCACGGLIKLDLEECRRRVAVAEAEAARIKRQP